MADASPRRTALDTIILQAKRDRKRLDSSAVGTFSLTAIGIASVVGGGIFVTTGVAAAQHAGPAVVLSFVFAGTAADHSALLRGARVDDPGDRQHLLVRLRGVRRLPRLVHRLGPPAGVHVRRLRGGRR